MILILLMVSLTIETDGSVSMCSNDTYTATNYQLTRILSDPSNCTCLLKSTYQTTTQVVFNMTSISGCRYKLGFYWDERFSFISCDSPDSIFHTLTSETIKLNLEPYLEGGSETFFIINITSKPETNLTLSCFVPRIETKSTQLPTSLITSTHQPTTPSTTAFNTKSMVSSTFTKTTQLSSIKTKQSTSQQHTISIITSSDEQTVAGDTSITSPTSPPLNTEQPEDKLSGDDSTVGIAVGCFIGGIVFGIFVVLGLLWFRLKRQKKDEIYSTPTHREDHTYASIIPGTEVGSINTTGETTRTSNDTIGEATVAPNSTEENRTNNPSVTYQNVTNNPYLNL